MMAICSRSVISYACFDTSKVMSTIKIIENMLWVLRGEVNDFVCLKRTENTRKAYSRVFKLKILLLKGTQSKTQVGLKM